VDFPETESATKARKMAAGLVVLVVAVAEMDEGGCSAKGG